MKRIITIPTLASLLIIGIVGVTSAQDNGPNGIDDVTAAEKPTPVTAPDDGRQVLVLRYQLSYEEGKVTGTELVRSERVDSIAPKVAARASGDWLVTAVGEQEFSFYTFDPARREATPHEETEAGYEWVVESGQVDWTLVVPLYGDNFKLDEVQQVQVSDAATGDLVFETDLDDGEHEQERTNPGIAP